MTIASAITNAQNKVAAAYTAVSAKGGTLPATRDLSNLPTAINSISGGGGVKTFGKSYQDSTSAIRKTSIDGSTEFSGITTIGSHGLSYSYAYASGAAGSYNDRTRDIYFNDLTTASDTNCLEGAFYHFNGIDHFYFPKLTNAGYSCFEHFNEGNNQLLGVYFPKLTTIGNRAFAESFKDCSGLQEVNFSEEMTTLNASAFINTFTNCHSGSPAVRFYAPIITGSFSSPFYYAHNANVYFYNYEAPAADPGTFNSLFSSGNNYTAHFPIACKANMKSWPSVSSGMGNAAATILWDLQMADINFNVGLTPIVNLGFYGIQQTNTTTYIKDVIVTGSPTYNISTGDVSDFTNDDYITLDTSVNVVGTDAMFVFTTGSDVTSNQALCLCKFVDDSSGFIIRNGTIQLMNKNKWASPSYQDTELSVQTNTKYYLRIVEQSNKAMDTYLSTDGTTFISGTQRSRTRDLGTSLGAGTDGTATTHFLGTIHLAECYIKLNGVTTWSAEQAASSTLSYQVGPGDIDYSAYYPSSNGLSFGTVTNIVAEESRTITLTEPTFSNTLTINVSNYSGNSVLLKTNGLTFEETLTNGSCTVNINNAASKTIDYIIPETATTFYSTGSITLTGSNQTETITPKTANFTVVGSLTIDETNISGFSDTNYLTTTVSGLPSDGFEFIEKITWPAGRNSNPCPTFCCVPQDTQFGKAYNNWSSKYLGLYNGSSDVGAYNMLPYDTERTVWFKYVQTSSGYEAYAIVDNNYTLDTLPSTGWTTLKTGSDTGLMTNGSYVIGRNGDLSYTNQYWPGSIDLASMVIRNTATPSTIYWEALT